MNQGTARAIMATKDYEWLLDWTKIHAELGTPPGLEAHRVSCSMDRIRWIAAGGTLETYPTIAKAAKLTQDAPEGQSVPVAVQEAGNGIADAESIRREVARVVSPLVLALERLAEGFATPQERRAARKLCGDARREWGEA